jgi:DNA primase
MAGHFSSNTEQIRAACDIVDIIGAVVPLKRAGANFIGLCPFHKEKTPSFNVSPHKQFFHCYGCHKGGDVFKFVQEYENVDFPEALRRLAEKAGIQLEFEKNPAAKQARHVKDILLEIHEQITQRWQAVLTHDAAGQAGRDYLAGRGVPAEAVSLFRIGFAPDAWDDTVNWAKSKGYETAIMEQAGLVVRKEGEQRCYDRFRGRLMFPICDEQGRVVAFSGRILDKEAKTAKYVNSPETPIFLKRKIFYGLDKSKRAILDNKFAIVCEGQLDLIACFMAGVQNIVAPQGTAFTADHARILKRFVNEVVLCFDSDLAGQSAAVRVLDDLLAADLAIRVAEMPPPHDPDSYIKAYGGEAFKKLIHDAKGFFDFYLGHLCRLHDPATDQGRISILNAMREAVQKTGNAVVMDACAQRTALKLAVSTESVRAEFTKAERERSAPERAEDEYFDSQEPAPARPSPKEFWLLKLLFQEGCDLEWTRAQLNLEWLQHESVKRIVDTWLASRAEEPELSPVTLSGQLTNPQDLTLFSEALCGQRDIPNAPQQLKALILWFRNQAIDLQLQQISRQLGAPDIPEELKLRLLRQQQELRLKKKRDTGPAKPEPEAASD